jgi:hypothetical protein
VGGVRRLIQTLLNAYQSRIPSAAAFAPENRVLLLKSAGGIALDLAPLVEIKSAPEIIVTLKSLF